MNESSDKKDGFLRDDRLADILLLALILIGLGIYVASAWRLLRSVNPLPKKGCDFNYIGGLNTPPAKWKWRRRGVRWLVYAFAFYPLSVIACQVLACTAFGVRPEDAVGGAFASGFFLMIVIGVATDLHFFQQLAAWKDVVRQRPDLINPVDDDAARDLGFDSVQEFAAFALWHDALRLSRVGTDGVENVMVQERLAAVKRMGFDEEDTERWWTDFRRLLPQLALIPEERMRWNMTIPQSETHVDLDGLDITPFSDEFLNRVSKEAAK